MFRFGIRDLLWLTLSSALAIGWSIDHRRIDRLEAEYARYSNQAWDAAAKAERDFAERLKTQSRDH